METKRKQIFVSTDIEANGPIPGMYSMLSFGSAAFSEDGKLIDTFYVNLLPLEDAKEDPGTMMWWNSPLHKIAYIRTRVDMITPELAMQLYMEWLVSLDGELVFVAYPAGFDFQFIYWYLIKFVGKSPFSFSALDIKTYFMAMMARRSFRNSTKRSMPSRWLDGSLPHNHNALDDALEQGHIFMNMYKENVGVEDGVPSHRELV